MPYQLKPPAPQAVAAALRRAGFNRAEPWNVGPREYTEGYKVRKSQSTPGSVEVQWLPSTFDSAGQIRQRRSMMLQRYADALVCARFRCRLDEPGGKLTVHARG